MFAACIFCSAALGRNQALEHFPVGRRLAFDAAKGRLWVVCRRCERWNLTPLETRWEAIEEAERQFRGMRLRASTDNIGLARLPEGLDLVRIGAPLLPEFAAWRYGDQFGRRRRKHVTIVGAGLAAGVAAPLVPLLVGVVSVVGAMSIVNAGWQLSQLIHMRRRRTRTRVTVRDEIDRVIPLTEENIRCAALVTSSSSGHDPFLALPYGPMLSVDERFKAMSRRGTAAAFEGYAQLTGAAAHRALSAMLPQLNVNGGRRRAVNDAVAVVNATPDPAHLIRQSADAATRIRDIGIKEGQTYMFALPPHFRLALEMVLHQHDERRAMDGELRELEQRWRDAEATAAIADSLTLPPDIDERLAELRGTALDGGTR